MDLLNNDLKGMIKKEEVPYEENYLDSLVELEDVLEDAELEDTKESDIQTLVELKSHIDKYGVSEETLSLFGKDLNQFGITEDTSKEAALESLEEVISHNTINETPETSEENLGVYIVSGIGLVMLLHGMISLLKRTSTHLVSSLVYFQKYKAMMKEGYWKKFEDESNKARVLPKQQLVSKLDGCINILKFLIGIDVNKIKDIDFNSKLALLKPVGYQMNNDGKPLKLKEKISKISVTDNGYDKNNIKEILDDAIALCEMNTKIKIVIGNITTLIKANKKSDSVSDDDKALLKKQIKLYKAFTKIVASESAAVTSQIVNLLRATVVLVKPIKKSKYQKEHDTTN